MKEPGDQDKDKQKEIALFDRFYLSVKRINQFAREDEILIYVVRLSKIDVNRRIKSEMVQKKNSWFWIYKKAIEK